MWWGRLSDSRFVLEFEKKMFLVFVFPRTVETRVLGCRVYIRHRGPTLYPFGNLLRFNIVHHGRREKEWPTATYGAVALRLKFRADFRVSSLSAPLRSSPAKH